MNPIRSFFSGQSELVQRFEIPKHIPSFPILSFFSANRSAILSLTSKTTLTEENSLLFSIGKKTLFLGIALILGRQIYLQETGRIGGPSIGKEKHFFDFSSALKDLEASTAFTFYKEIPEGSEYTSPGSMNMIDVASSLIQFDDGDLTQEEINHEERVTREALSHYIHPKHFISWVRHIFQTDTVWKTCETTSVLTLSIESMYENNRNIYPEARSNAKYILSFYQSKPEILFACWMYETLLLTYLKELRKAIETSSWAPGKKQKAHQPIENLVSIIGSARPTSSEALPLPFAMYCKENTLDLTNLDVLCEIFSFAFSQTVDVFSSQKHGITMKCPFFQTFHRCHSFSVDEKASSNKGFFLAQLVLHIQQKALEKDPIVLKALEAIKTKIQDSIKKSSR